MATKAYEEWVRKGRPYTVAEPIKQLVAMARNAGVRIVGVIGDMNHLQASKPQDHTPFSVTAWPNPLPGYVVTACDTENGPWSQRLLDAAKRGDAPYIKYMNFGGKNYDVRRNWSSVGSSDQHLHVSCRTDYLNHRPTYNPFTGEVGAMAGEADKAFSARYTGVEPFISGESWMAKAVEFPLRSINSKLDALLGRPLMSNEQIRELAAQLAQETDVSTVETALRNVLLKGVETDGS